MFLLVVLVTQVLQRAAGDKIVHVLAGTNITLPCEAVLRHTNLHRRSDLSAVWSCAGCSLHETLIVSGNVLAPVVLARVDRFRVVKLLERTGRLSVTASTCSLHYSPTLLHDSGQYRCHVQDRSDTIAKSSVQLVVQDVPSVPSRPMIQDFDSRSVTLSWAGACRANNSPIKHFHIYTKQDENGRWNSTPIVTGDNATQYRVESLAPFTTYSFRLVAVNGVGPSQVGVASHPIITLWEVPSIGPKIIAARNSSSTSVLLRWRPLSSSELRGEFQNYRLTFRRNSDLHSAIEEVRIDNENVQSYNVTGLQPYTLYVISLQVRNSAGLGPSSTAIVSTDEGVPSPPGGVTVSNVTSSSVRLSWQVPSPANAAITGYQLQLISQGRSRELQLLSTALKQQQQPSALITDLTPFTNYSVRVRALAGPLLGAWSSPVPVATDVTPPSPPRLTSVTCQLPAGLLVAWRRPLIFPHTLAAYWVHVQVATTTAAAPADQLQLQEHLVEEEHGDGDDSTEHTDTRLQTTSTQESGEQNVVIKADINKAQDATVVTNLTAGVTYLVRVRAVAESVSNPSVALLSEPSLPERVPLLPAACVAAAAAGRQTTAHVWRHSGAARGAATVHLWSASGVLVASGVLLLLLLLLFSITAMSMWRRYLSSSYRKRKKPVSQLAVLTKEQAWESCAPADAAAAPIAARDFAAHVARLHADSDIGFSKEYDEVMEYTMKLGLSSQLSQHEENRPKNRYQNIDAYDHSLVPLQRLPGQRQGDYINANYVDGFRCARQYIAAQGPMASTLHAFWRLVWEQRVHVIVMMTNLVERCRRKCDLYWPTDGTETYGFIQVETLSETEFATYTLRKFRLSHIKEKRPVNGTGGSTGNRGGAGGSSGGAGGGEGGGGGDTWQDRVVTQYHYTNWPDHGVPDHPLPVLNFVVQSSDENTPHGSPLLVHCSAGVGRTGAYIVLDAMRAMLRSRGSLNVFGYLRHIRGQRNFLVQTEEQYVFVHEALLQLLRTGDTCICSDQLADYWRRLQAAPTSHNGSLHSLEQQYQCVRGCAAEEHSVTAALADYNVAKNRSTDFLPSDCWRVYLPSRPGDQGSEYINASFIMGFESLSEFIITQHPLTETVPDFWRMVSAHSVRTVLVLSPLDDQFVAFWPQSSSECSAAANAIRFVEQLQLSSKADQLPDSSHCVSLRVSASTSAGVSDDNSGTLCLLHAPILDLTPPAATVSCHQLQQLLQLMTAVDQLADSHSPLVVVDRYGGTQAAQFCCLLSLYKQHRHGGCVDPCLYATLCSQRRPGVWPRQSDYTVLYRAMELAVSCAAAGSDPVSSPATDGSQSAAAAVAPADCHERVCLVHPQSPHSAAAADSCSACCAPQSSDKGVC